MQYRFISDPGHGWLEVSTEELEHLNIAKKISPFSYRSGPKAYLEEDCDLSVFIKAKEEAGEEVEFLEVYQENTPIRSYQSYGWGDA